MGLVEPVVRTEMHRGGDQAGRRGRADNFAVPGKRTIQFDPDLQVDLVVQVESPACTRDLLRGDDIPHLAARLGNDRGKFVQTRLTAHDGKRMAAELFESDLVLHMNRLGWSIIWTSTQTLFQSPSAPSSRTRPTPPASTPYRPSG